jgi:hypothetical protein
MLLMECSSTAAPEDVVSRRSTAPDIRSLQEMGSLPIFYLIVH